MAAKQLTPLRKVGQFVVNLPFEGLIRLAQLLPYETRVPLVGWITSRVFAPLAGYNRRIRANLALVWPDLPEAEVKRLLREVPDNAGRTLAELYSTEEFKERLAKLPLEGDGVQQMIAAQAAGRPIIMVGGHFGNYDAMRGLLIQRYERVGALYRPQNNIYFNRHYAERMNAMAQPLFPRGRRGLAEMVKFLRSGHMVGLLIDQYVSNGTDLTFFGRKARTTLSAAEMALKYDALMIPFHAVRKPDGLTFQMIVEAPIPHSDAVTMSQEFNDRLEVMVRKHPGQWLWVHRRWKVKPE
ncbi:lysophospholipid acyltransferase family protein [Pseudooceanicola nanhaiensis]|uniref:lysophospholipid acyltransferase family protein n=1 Tax=Pseudooceanicola nanhaiensis TaxID=375761 RepID=UPI001CD201B6|nr:lysophospholipid acyltransferase family protein [Pseudooceanicola nanhaiensis]MCA0919677.1 lysophospholipid acyltransferase family protein [Pseudooceanicola nanhaiensis]